MTYNQCVERRDVSCFTVARIVRVCATDGLNEALKYHSNENSGNAHRKKDGRMEATIVQIACGLVPEGHACWIISMLTDEMKIRFGKDSIGRDIVRRTLKNEIKPHRSQYWCLPPVADAEFIATMEGVLDVYERPYDPSRMVVCLDEKPY